MKKRMVSIAVCAVMLLTFSQMTSANSGGDPLPAELKHTGEKKVYTLSLKDAIAMAREKDPAFMSADVKIKDAERQLVQARKNKSDMEGIPIRVSQGVTSFALQRGYFVKQAEVGVESAKKEKEQKIANSAYSVTQQYFAVKLSERVLGSAKTGLDMAKNNFETVKMQFSLGLVSELDVKNAELAVKQAQSTYDKYERTLTLARKSLVVALFIDEDNFELNLTDDIEYKDFSADLSKDTESAMKTRYDVYMLESSFSLAEFMADIADLYGGTSSEYSSANQARVQSEVTCNNSKKMIAVSINSSYNAILDARDALAVAEDKLALRQQEYSVACIQLELGLITNTQLTAIMSNVTAAQIELDNSKLTYKLAVEKYGYDTTIGL